MTQAVEHLLCKCEALSSNTLSHQKKKKNKKENSSKIPGNPIKAYHQPISLQQH
jgi:hypothetical protein